MTTAPLVVFLDSDMIADQDLAESVASAFDADVDLAHAVIPERSFGANFWGRCKALEKELYLGDATVEAARAFRRDAFEAVGGYNESLTGPEDWDLPDRLRREGFRGGRVSAGVRHDEGAPSLRQLYVKKRYYAAGVRSFIDADKSNARSRLVRISLVRHPTRLARHPALAVGLFVVKLVELAAVLVGARARPEPSATPAD